MGYTVWHDVAAGREPDEKVDHLVLGPSGLYGVLSEDFGGPVRVRRGELFGEGVEGTPVGEPRLAHAGGRARGRRPLQRCDRRPSRRRPGASDRGDRPRTRVPVAVVARSALSTMLRRGLTGAREIGGNEVFDVRTRLQHAVRHV